MRIILLHIMCFVFQVQEISTEDLKKSDFSFLSKDESIRRGTKKSGRVGNATEDSDSEPDSGTGSIAGEDHGTPIFDLKEIPQYLTSPNGGAFNTFPLQHRKEEDDKSVLEMEKSFEGMRLSSTLEQEPTPERKLSSFHVKEKSPSPPEPPAVQLRKRSGVSVRKQLRNSEKKSNNKKNKNNL